MNKAAAYCSAIRIARNRGRPGSEREIEEHIRHNAERSARAERGLDGESGPLELFLLDDGTVLSHCPENGRYAQPRGWELRRAKDRLGMTGPEWGP